MKDVLKAVLSLVSGVILSRFVWSYTESTHNVERTENSLHNVVCVYGSYPLKHLCMWTVASLLPVSNWKKLELFCLTPKARLSGDFFKQECSICYFLLCELLLISREDWIGKYFLLYILEKKPKKNNYHDALNMNASYFLKVCISFCMFCTNYCLLPIELKLHSSNLFKGN